MATTSRGYPLVGGTDDFDVAADMNALAQAIDADMTALSATGEVIYDGTTTLANNTPTVWNNFTDTSPATATGCTTSSNGITVTNAGVYYFVVKATYATSGTGRRAVAPTVNGAVPTHTQSKAVDASSNGPTIVETEGGIRLAAGDKLGVQLSQTSGGALAVSAADIFITRAS